MKKYNNQIIKELIDNDPELLNSADGLPDIGRRLDRANFSKPVKRMERAIRIFYNEIKQIDKEVDNNIPKNSLGGGSPAEFPPFKPSLIEIKKTLQSGQLYKYPKAAGNEEHRATIIPYLVREGFVNDNPINKEKVIKNGLSIDNIIFTFSTTHAYSLILETIMRPHDVIIIPGPGYSLFAFNPERINATVEVLNLREEDNWYVNSKLLEEKINKINKSLKKKYQDKLSYTPRVKAFLNINPNNPLGKVLSNKNIEILKEIGKICLDKNIFVIDDMLYRDLTYDRSNIAKPLATIPKMFDNTITLFGLSKSYGMAGIRAGMIIANEIVIKSIKNRLFQQMDSTSLIQSAALAGSFNITKGRDKEYKKYFDQNIKEYQYRYNLVKAIVDGIDSIKNLKVKKEILKDLNKEIKNKDELNKIIKGMQNVSFVKNTEPEAGFFALLDFTKLKGKKYKEYSITNELELLKFYYKYVRVKFFIGSSMAWPNKDQLIARVTFSLKRSDLIRIFKNIAIGASLLK